MPSSTQNVEAQSSVDVSKKNNLYELKFYSSGLEEYRGELTVMENVIAHATQGTVSPRDGAFDTTGYGSVKYEIYGNPVTPAQACEDEETTAMPGRRATPSSLSSSSFASVEYNECVKKDLHSVFESMGVKSDDEGCQGVWCCDDSKEPILMENDERFCLLPVKYHKAYEYYKMAQASYWTVEEVDLSQDKRDWDRLSEHEKHFISYVLAFFAASDGIVLENLAVRFMQGMCVLLEKKGECRMIVFDNSCSPWRTVF